MALLRVASSRAQFGGLLALAGVGGGYASVSRPPGRRGFQLHRRFSLAGGVRRFRQVRQRLHGLDGVQIAGVESVLAVAAMFYFSCSA